MLGWPQSVLIQEPQNRKQINKRSKTIVVVCETFLSQRVKSSLSSTIFCKQFDWLMCCVHHQCPNKKNVLNVWASFCYTSGFYFVANYVRSFTVVIQWSDVSSTASLPWTRFACVVSSVCCCCHLKYTKQNETKPTQEQCYLQTHVLIVFPSRHNTQVSSKPTHAFTPGM